jgi:hypothetical protein
MVPTKEQRPAVYLDSPQVATTEPMSVEKKVFPRGNEWVVKLVVLLEFSSDFQKAKQKEKNSAVLSDEKSESTKE